MMMSEKRFTLEQWTEESLYFSDGEFSAHMSIGYICKKVEKKLNEQQATIRRLQDLCGKSDYENAKLREEVNLLKPTNIEQYEQIIQLQKENEKHIERYHQLIGHIQRLQKIIRENKTDKERQLETELQECENFRHYIFEEIKRMGELNDE